MPDHILKSKPEIYTAYLPSGPRKIQFSLALQLLFTNSTCFFTGPKPFLGIFTGLEPAVYCYTGKN